MIFCCLFSSHLTVTIFDWKEYKIYNEFTMSLSCFSKTSHHIFFVLMTDTIIIFLCDGNSGLKYGSEEHKVG